jgi:gamma-glutamylcysteine synthetase
MVRSVQTVHLSCTDTNIVSKRTKTRFNKTHITYEFHRVRPKLFMSLWHIQCKPYTYLASTLALSPNGLNRAPPDPRHLGAPLGASKTIYEPMVRYAQTVHLSCTDTNTISKRTKMRFHTAHVTYEFHRVRPKLFMSLWYVMCKPCTYLASRLALSPNGPNRPPPDPRH